MTGKLLCHKIDLSNIHYLNTLELSNYLSKDSEILSRKVTGLCSKCQRRVRETFDFESIHNIYIIHMSFQVAKTIKRSRNCGVLSHIGEFEIESVEVSKGDARLSKNVL